MKTRLAPGIVCIGLAILCPGLASGSGEPGFSAAFVQRQYDLITPALCLVGYSSEITNPATGESTKRDTRALGVIVSEEGLVMAHGHMQSENSHPFNVRVKVGQGDDEREYDATVLKKPDDVNLCFLQILAGEGERFPHVSFDKGGELTLGDPILIFGMLGETLDFSRAARTRRVASVIEKPRTTYCIDEPLPFGFVCGPVVNTNGRAVGVVGYDLSAQEGGELYVRSGHPLVFQAGLFAQYISSPPSETDLNQTKADAWLGIFTQPLSDDLAEYWGMDRDGGVVVSTIVPDSPAVAAGLQRGDVIVELNGTRIRAKQNRELIGFTKMVRETGVGTTVPIKLVRDGTPMELELTLTERPKSARDAGEFQDDVFGLTVREITTDLRYRLNLSDDVQGVIVRRVKSGSWAQIAGIRPGVIILSFGGYPASTLAEFREAADKVADDKPSEVTAFCRVGARTGFFRLKPRWERDEQE